MPMHGAAKMNELYYNFLNKKFNVKKIKINYSNSIDEIGSFNIKKFFGVFIVFFKLLSSLIFFRPNLIYFEIAPRGFAFVRDSIYVLLCKIFRKKIIFAIHARGLNKAAVNGLKLKYFRFIFNNTKMILLSELLYRDVSNVISKKDIYILPNGIENEISDEKIIQIIKQRQKSKTINFLFLSNMIEEKGPMDVLKFCKILKDKNIKFRCSFVGAFVDEKFKDNWEREIKNYNLETECNYLGPKYGDEKISIFSDTDFFIFPTKYSMECFPLVILESFMYGIPTLSYDVGAIADIINKNFLGIISKKKTLSDLVNGFFKIRSKVERSRIRNHFKKYYTLDVSGEKLNSIIEKEI